MIVPHPILERIESLVARAHRDGRDVARHTR